MLTDLKYLQQMTGDDSEMMKEMVELFLLQLAELRVDMDSLVESQNWFELSRLAHKVKSSALVMGIVQMSDEMKQLELLAKEGKNTEKYPDYVARFHDMIEITETELNLFLDSCK